MTNQEFRLIADTSNALLALGREIEPRIQVCYPHGIAYLNLTSIQMTLNLLAVGLATVTEIKDD